MKSLTQAQIQSTLETTETPECPPDPKALNEQETPKMAVSEPLAPDNTVTTVKSSETSVGAEETHTTTAEKEPAILSPGNTERKDPDINAKSDSLTKQAPGPESKPDLAKKTNCARKYVLSKKAMIDPLKMDMSKPVVMPLTSSELSLQCLACHIIFQDDKSKLRHLKLNHPLEYANKMLSNSRFTCYVCDRPFTNSLDLMVHQKSHAEETPFKCPICSQAFKRASHLSVHKKAHIDQGWYTCTHCGKKCKTLTLLKYHNFTHTEKPYGCKKCGKRFSWLKAYERHMEDHLSGRTDQDGNIRKTQLKKKDGSSTGGHSCPICKACFTTMKSRQRHIKSKHILLPGGATIANQAGKKVKQSTPIITPISISQPSLLELEANGPLQKVDGNIDTEQIRKLIESMENVQKVNQVVILGQVPPHASPLEVQQTTQFPASPSSNLNPPRTGLIESNQTNISTLESDTSNNNYDPMEQTIILEPITPDGQLINRPFSELASHLSGQQIELTLVQADQIERPLGEGIHQIEHQPPMDAISSATRYQMLSESAGESLNPSLEQMVILELTPVLSPTLGLEQFETMPLNDISFISEAKGTLSEISNQTAGQTEKEDTETNPIVPSYVPTLEVEQTSWHTEQQDLSLCSFVQQDATQHTLCPDELDAITKVVINSQLPAVNQEEVCEVVLQKTQKKTEAESTITVLEKKRSVSKKQELSSKKRAQTQIQAKQVPCPPEVPINVMSAQELVKVRKRKPARTFIFQGCMQGLLGSIYEDDLKLTSKPAKRRKTKESHLVKFSPQSKGAKNKKDKKLPQTGEPMQDSLSKSKIRKSEKVPPQKKARKGNKNTKAENVLPTKKVNATSLANASPLQTMKEHSKKSKKKKQKEVTKVTVPQKPVTLPRFKKNKQAKKVQKEQAKSAEVEKTKAGLTEEEKVDLVDLSISHITQDCLLLLKGHKQPQLKVYKLDPTKASGQATDPLTLEVQTNTQNDGKKLNHPINNSTAEVKKKGERTKKNQKALSLLSSLKNSCKTPPETPTTKPKTTRKRKSSSKLEIEGIISSTKRFLECKECGEIFSEVSSLQKHKMTAHVVESPSLTYTNGNIFEGVSNVDIYQLPKSPKSVRLTNSATDWDTEPEIAMEDRERTVSFPALIPSPSLPIPPADMEINGFENTGGHVTDTNQQLHTSQGVDSPTVKAQKAVLKFTSRLSPKSLNNTSETEKTQELSPPEDQRLEQSSQINIPSVSGVVSAIEDDFKDDLLLEVDLVTVGEKNEKEDSTCNAVSVPQNKLNESCNSRDPEPANDEQPQQNPTLQTVSCSTHRAEVKEEEEEEMLQRKKGTVREKRAVSVRGGKKISRKLVTKQGSVGDTANEMNSEKEHVECQVVCEKHPIISESDQETEKNTLQFDNNSDIRKSTTTVAALLSTSSAFDCSPEDVSELKSMTPSVHGLMNKTGMQGVEEHDRQNGESPLIILEKLVTSKQRVTTENEPERMTMGHYKQVSVSTGEDGALSPESPSIKDEEQGFARQNIQGTSVSTQHHQDIRTVLVKEESSVIPEDAQNTKGNKRIRWNVEPVSNEDTNVPVIESSQTPRDSRVTTELSSSQCIFYPVKVEEREMPVGVGHAHRGCVNPEICKEPSQMEHQTAVCPINEGSHPVSDDQETTVQGLLSEPGDSDYSNNQESQPSPNLREFLLQSSDEEDGGSLELCDSQIDSEAEIMAYFNQNQTSSCYLPHLTSPNSTGATSAIKTREPIEYFCKYFDVDTWVEIAECTNRASSILNPVTSREVAHFVGIHIAMGTLKFPCSKLYWKDLTRVPLIAEAMAMPRFLELTHKLKLNSPESTSATRNASNHYFTNAAQGTAHSSNRSCKKVLGGQSNKMTTLHSQTNPLWKVQPLLRRFNAGCQSLRQEDDYAVDHYPLQLTGRIPSNKIFLNCTSLIGFSGSLSRVELTLNFADKEEAVKKMVPKGSMVFLCKQELSTPAMLERLLAAGVNGAGMVGGSRGQVGDEFVSSDGRLMLRRSHRGFILSTAGSSLKSMTSLIENFDKAQMSARFNKDLQNLYTTPFTATLPTCWPQAVLWYLTDLALVNSWLQYRKEQLAMSAPLTLMAFRLEVSKALIFSSGSDTQDSVPPRSRTEQVQATNKTSNPIVTKDSPLPDAATRYDGSGHWPEQLGEGEGGQCRFGDCQRISRVLCLKCCVFLCISRNHNCFLNFHSQRSLEKE